MLQVKKYKGIFCEAVDLGYINHETVQVAENKGEVHPSIRCYGIMYPEIIYSKTQPINRYWTCAKCGAAIDDHDLIALQDAQDLDEINLSLAIDKFEHDEEVADELYVKQF